MDIPLSGALFITNPRRKRRRVVTRDNGAKDRMIARQTGRTLKSVKAMKAKNYAAYQKLFKDAGGEAALKKYKAKGQRTRAAVKDGSYTHSTWGKGSTSKSKSKSTSRKKSAMKNNPRRKKSVWQRYLKAASGKGYSMAELRAGYKTLVRKHGNNAAKIVAAAKAFKAKAGAAPKKRKSTKRKSASKAPARLGFSLSRVQRVVRKKGKNGRYNYFAVLGRSGTVMKRISKATYNMLRAKGIGAKGRTLKKRKTTRKTTRKAAPKRRTTTRRSSAARGRSRAKVTAKRAKRARPKGGLRKIRTKRGMRFMLDGKFISKAKYNSMLPAGLRVANPRRRKNPGLGALALRKNGRARKNPGVLGGALNLFDRSADMLARVPLAGRFARLVPTVGVFATTGLIHYYAMRYLGPRLPELGAKIGGLIGQEELGYGFGVRTQMYGYSLGGATIGALLLAGHRFLPKLFPSQRASEVFALAALGGGITLDVVDALKRRDGSEASMDANFEAGEDMDPMLGQQQTLSGLAYTSGALNGLAYTSGELNGVAMDSGADLVQSYAGAHLGDAAHCGPDFDAAEGQALMMGPAAYKARFGLPAARGFFNRMGMSPMAGRPGHRWAWLVKMIGFNRAAKLASMSPRKRMAVIAKLRAQAKQTIDQANYGALAYKGGALNGLAYTDGALNGVVYTGGVL